MMLRDRRKGLTEGGGGIIIVRRRQRAGGLPPEDVASERDAFRRPLTGGSEHGEPTARRLAAADAPGQGAPEPRAAWQGEERGGSGRVARRGTEPSGPRLSPVTGTPGNRTCPAAGGSCICLAPPALSALPRPPPEWESGRPGDDCGGRRSPGQVGAPAIPAPRVTGAVPRLSGLSAPPTTPRVGEWETGRRLRRTPVTGPGGRAGHSRAASHRSGRAGDPGERPAPGLVPNGAGGAGGPALPRPAPKGARSRSWKSPRVAASGGGGAGWRLEAAAAAGGRRQGGAAAGTGGGWGWPRGGAG